MFPSIFTLWINYKCVAGTEFFRRHVGLMDEEADNQRPSGFEIVSPGIATWEQRLTFNMSLTPLRLWPEKRKNSPLSSLKAFKTSANEIRLRSQQLPAKYSSLHQHFRLVPEDTLYPCSLKIRRPVAVTSISAREFSLPHPMPLSSQWLRINLRDKKIRPLMS